MGLNVVVWPKNQQVNKFNVAEMRTLHYMSEQIHKIKSRMNTLERKLRQHLL